MGWVENRLRLPSPILLVLLIFLVMVVPRFAFAEADESRNEDWQILGTCEWTVDDAGTLMLRPAEGFEEGHIDKASGEWAALNPREFKCLGPVSSDSAEGFFENCKDLRYVDLSNLDLTGVPSIDRMFYGCKN